jgi:hypothetical protein
MEAAIRVLLGPPNDLGRIRDNATDIALGAHSPIEYSRDSLQAAPRSLGEAFLAITQDRNGLGRHGRERSISKRSGRSRCPQLLAGRLKRPPSYTLRFRVKLLKIHWGEVAGT